MRSAFRVASHLHEHTFTAMPPPQNKAGTPPSPPRCQLALRCRSTDHRLGGAACARECDRRNAQWRAWRVTSLTGCAGRWLGQSGVRAWWPPSQERSECSPAWLPPRSPAVTSPSRRRPFAGRAPPPSAAQPLSAAARLSPRSARSRAACPPPATVASAGGGADRQGSGRHEPPRTRGRALVPPAFPPPPAGAEEAHTREAAGRGGAGPGAPAARRIAS